VTILPGAGHYTFIETCLPAAIWRLGIICQDPTGVDRDSVHRVAVTEALRVFATALGNR
jgi:predicted dienelactone hydrolase